MPLAGSVFTPAMWANGQTPPALDAEELLATQKSIKAALGTGTCSTAAATAAKTVTLDGFALISGARISVNFTNGNTAASMTLNVNGTGAIACRCRGNAPTPDMIPAGLAAEFCFDGSYWQLVNPSMRYGGTATLTVAGWGGTAAPFTQGVACGGILATDTPVLDCLTGTDPVAGLAIVEAWGLAVSGGRNPQTSAGTITFYASAKPAVAIPFRWEGTR
ncbi:MAG: hypothetical protein RR235_08875 [Oscillospiraceae bacterium]